MAMRFERPMKGLNQPAGVLHRGVIGVVTVWRDVFNDEVDAAGAGAGVIPLAHGLRFPGIDAFPVDPVGNVHMTVGQNLSVEDSAEGQQQNRLMACKHGEPRAIVASMLSWRVTLLIAIGAASTVFAQAVCSEKTVKIAG